MGSLGGHLECACCVATMCDNPHFWFVDAEYCPTPKPFKPQIYTATLILACCAYSV